MSKDLGYKQAQNVESRRTWDRDYYEAKAKERLEKGDDFKDKNDAPARRSNKEEFQVAPAGAAGPAGSARAYLKVRSTRLSKCTVIWKTLEGVIGRKQSTSYPTNSPLSLVGPRDSGISGEAHDDG